MKKWLRTAKNLWNRCGN